MENKIHESVSFNKPRTSSFDKSHEVKLSAQMGDLIPVLVEEIIPGDRVKLNTESAIRLAPMLAPLQHRVNVFFHSFFVPNRLVWDEWEDFITGGDDGTSSPTMPLLTGTTTAPFTKGTLVDYFGIPVHSGAAPTTPYNFISELPFRAYHLIWSEYYRDQQLQTEFDPNAANTDAVLTALRKRAWEKDYFTSALPAPQKGSDQTIASSVLFSYDTQSTVVSTDTSGSLNNNSGSLLVDLASARIENIDQITSTMDIDDLRVALHTQQWWETANRAGSRYTEQIQAHFGVKIPDKQYRPSYLGGSRQPVVISEVLNTSGAGTDPQGQMTGHGISVGQGGFSETFQEHGHVITIMSVLPRTSYQQGVDKKFLRTDKFDYFFPEFAHLGEQAVENRELYFDPSTGADDPTGTFGYQQRYAEYKSAKSIVCGDYRDDLDYWHMTRQFTSEPTLNETFIQSDPTHRIFANTSETDDKLWIQLYHQLHMTRPMPYFADPRL